MIDSRQLLKIARELATSKGRGRPRSGALRRSISTSYYALFHFLLTSAADLLVGVTERNKLRYRLVYRAFDHGRMRSCCENALKPGHFGVHIRECAASFMDLQDTRHKADYDPSAPVTLSEAKAAIERAEGALQRFGAAPEAEKRLFLTLLHFRPRP